MPSHTPKERAKKKSIKARSDNTRTARPKARNDGVTAGQRKENFRGVPKRLGLKPKTVKKRERRP